MYGQNSEEKTTPFEISGTIVSENKSNLALANCIANNAMVMGVTAYTETESESLESSYVKGSYAYTYYVNNYELEAGSIQFKYSYFIKDGNIQYSFYDFKHDGTGTKFKSIGNLPEKWNHEVGEIVTENQYNEIMKDVLLNAKHSIRMIQKYCAN